MTEYTYGLSHVNGNFRGVVGLVRKHGTYAGEKLGVNNYVLFNPVATVDLDTMTIESLDKASMAKGYYIGSGSSLKYVEIDRKVPRWEPLALELDDLVNLHILAGNISI